MVRIFRRISRYVPVASMIFVLLGIIAAALHITFIFNADFADWFNDTISQAFREFMANLTGWFPFSLAETILISSPLLIVIVYRICLKKALRGKRYFGRVLIGLVSFIVLLYAMFVFIFGAGYRTNTLDKKLGIERKDVSASELAKTMRIVVDKINGLCDDVTFVVDTGSVRPYQLDENVELALESYDKLSEKYDFIHNFDSSVKQIILSPIMTYTHISGVYTYFTGEANLNTNYPYFVNAYTVAHEMAHQRGIARENEANFVAYLVCIESDDVYMQYSGYLNMIEYLSSALYTADTDTYYNIISTLDIRARYDLQCYSDFFDKYRENTAADVSDTVNDTYLKIQGTEGSRSYGMVVDLAVAYYLSGSEETGN